MDAAAVRERASDLPDSPGVYQFRDGDRTLYVGKAVSLRDRVRSYVDPRSPRIERMVDGAEKIEIAVTDTETQALLLEANLIKRLAPRYNVRLTDDKSYPLLQLTDHEFPRIEITRDPDEGATVFGPYTNKGRVETVLKTLRETFGLRGCSDHKFAGRDRPCLDHEMGLCTAPCTGEIGEAAYLEDVESVERFLEGATGVLAEPIETEMAEAATEANFERAAHLRDRLEAVEAFHGERSEAVHSSEGRTMDVLGAVLESDGAVVARLRAEGGQLVERDRHALDAPGTRDTPDTPADDSDVADAGAVLSAFVPQFYAERELPDALALSHGHGDDELGAWLDREGVEVSVPGAGREATLVDLALKNARRGDVSRDGVTALARSLGLDSTAVIEGFDVSHAGGQSVVGSDVRFVDGEPEKSGYRRKKLPDRNDDYANMVELIEWRARRAIEDRDDRSDPDLLLIDGGEGQLGAAREALEAVGWTVPAVALAKAEETVITVDGPRDWPADAPQVRLLRRVREEAHRFAVQYHRSLRDEVSTVLDSIEGVGAERRRRLLRRFGSIEGVRQASVAELADVDGVGRRTADRIARRL
ncbi:MAG: excinuclease ABC subunit C [Halobacteriales archaeon]